MQSLSLLTHLAVFALPDSAVLLLSSPRRLFSAYRLLVTRPSWHLSKIFNPAQFPHTAGLPFGQSDSVRYFGQVKRTNETAEHLERISTLLISFLCRPYRRTPLDTCAYFAGGPRPGKKFSLFHTLFLPYSCPIPCPYPILTMFYTCLVLARYLSIPRPRTIAVTP